MNVLNKITVQTLKKNRTRTIVTIIGIILSATMICAVTTFAGSLMNYGKECTVYTEGNWHIRQVDTEYKAYEDVLKNEKLEKATYLQQIGYSNSDISENEIKPYIYVLGAGKDSEDFLPIHITSGKYPTNSTEIILPEHLYTDGGVKHKIGDTITLELGNRMLNGDSLTQSDPCFNYAGQDYESNGEVLETRETRTYTVVGFYQRLSNTIEDYQSPGYTAFTIADNTPSADYKYDVYLRLNNAQDVEAFLNQQEYNCDKNTELLMFSGVFTIEGFTRMLYALAAIIILLIMVGSIALIYNAFSISVSERTKQFGLLSSVGATKKQIHHMVLFEALSVSVIGIPLGVICGIAGIGVTLMFVGNVFNTMSIPVDLSLSVSAASVIIAIIIALFTVFISAWIPSRRSTKISAVDAIRQSVDITTKGKNIKTPKLIGKLFGIPGIIADKHYKRNKKKYRTTVISLFMSIVLFVSASAFTDYLIGTVSDTSRVTDYEIALDVKPSQFENITPEKLNDRLKSADGVTDIAYLQSMYLSAKIDKEYLSKEVAENIENTMTNNAGSNNYISLNISFVDDNSYKALLKEHGLSEQMYMNAEKPLAIALDGVSVYNSGTGRSEKIYLFSEDNVKLEVQKDKEISGYYFMGETEDENGNKVIRYKKDSTLNTDGDDTIDLSVEEAYINKTLEIGKVIDEFPFFVGNIYETYLIYPYSLADDVFEEFTGENNTFCYKIKSDNHTKSINDIETILVDNGINNPDLSDFAQSEETRRNNVAVIQVFAYGFVILISLISAANVFNTISTNISLRRREFAILKSIGMTRKDFNKMMNFECLLYGSRALLYGLPVSVLVTYLIYHSVRNSVDVAFYLPWNAIGIVVLSVFLVVFVTMLYSMRKIKKDNPIDALKNENI